MKNENTPLTTQQKEMPPQHCARLIDNLNRIEVGIFGSLSALTEANLRETITFEKMCRIQNEIEAILKDLKPTVSL